MKQILNYWSKKKDFTKKYWYFAKLFSYNPNLVRMPIFGRTFIGHNPAIFGNFQWNFAWKIRRLLSPSYHAHLTILIFLALFARKMAWPPCRRWKSVSQNLGLFVILITYFETFRSELTPLNSLYESWLTVQSCSLGARIPSRYHAHQTSWGRWCIAWYHC